MESHAAQRTLVKAQPGRTNVRSPSQDVFFNAKVDGGIMATMKAAIVPMKGADFQIVEREIPTPGAGHVRIKAQA